MYTQGTKILRLRNKSHLLGEQEYCVPGTNFVYSGNKNIASEEPISCSREQEILHSRNKSCILKEQEYYVRSTRETKILCLRNR
jgi:hypothetical protein